MIALGSPATAKLQAQIGEGLATVAEMDFPEEWEGLVDVSCSLHILDKSSQRPGTGCEPVARQLCHQQRSPGHCSFNLQAVSSIDQGAVADRFA